MALLHIYDSSDSGIVGTAKNRSAEKKLPISSKNDLMPYLDELNKEGKKYDRILFETHGKPGEISFNHQSISRAYWLKIPGRYNSLTAPFTRIYFNGCNVAEDEIGWRFLEAVARAFMPTSNGEVFGHTSWGLDNPFPFGSHTWHFWGEVRTVYVKGGIIGRSKDDTFPN
jgi:hypothetical protein